jgi:hypothetical protein
MIRVGEQLEASLKVTIIHIEKCRLTLPPSVATLMHEY